MKLPTEEQEEVLSAALPAEEAGETPPRLVARLVCHAEQGGSSVRRVRR